MELLDLRTALRIYLDDESDPPLYSDETLNRYLNNAVREACLRTRQLKDDADSNASLCILTITEDTARYPFDPCILGIRSAIMAGATCKLTPMSSRQMDKVRPGWDNGEAATGTPQYMIVDTEKKTVALYPIPDSDGTLRLRVWRVPTELETMEEDDDEPAIDLVLPEELKHWAAYECYMQKDGELYDPQRAQNEEAAFSSVFGARPTAQEIQRWHDTPGTVNRTTFF